MKKLFRNHLFNHRILVCNSGATASNEEQFCTLVTLANKFGIRITEGSELAEPSMIRDASEFLGNLVPEPFYRGFPETVRALTPEQKLFDQLLHYAMTYGLGEWVTPGHSFYEDDFKRVAFKENVEMKDFRILAESQAEVVFLDDIRNLLKSSRPLNPDQEMLVMSAWGEYHEKILPDWIPCKHTAIMLLYETKSQLFEKYLTLPDTIKLLEYIQYHRYQSENLKKLNLKNQDRKLITRFIRNQLINGSHTELPNEVCDCFEKRQIWKGLLHHIHYKPTNNLYEQWYLDQLRYGANLSDYSEFEHWMDIDDRIRAVHCLYEGKGPSAVLRNLNYILSRCETETEVKEVLACLE